MDKQKEESLNELSSLLLSFVAQDLIDQNTLNKVITIQRGTHDNFKVQVGILEDTDKIIKVEFKLIPTEETIDDSTSSRDVPKGYH